MATARRIELTAEEEQTLRMWTRAGTTEPRLSRRAKVILCCAQGLPIRAVGEQCGLSQISVFKWKRRFLERRLDGLADEQRPGRPASINAAQRLAVIGLATSTPLQGKTSWSVRDLAQASGLSATTVHRILSAGKLRPHKVEYWCGRSPDPEFEAKQAAILGLYPRARPLRVDDAPHPHHRPVAAPQGLVLLRKEPRPRVRRQARGHPRPL